MSWPPESHHSLHSLPSTFNNFSKLPTEVGRRIYSSPFMIGAHEFRILLCPGGYNSDVRDYVSIFLELNKPSTVIRLTYALTIIDLNGTKHFASQRGSVLFDVPGQKSCYGRNKFILRSHLLDKVLNSTNDQLIVLCEIVDLNEPECLYSLQRLSSYRKYFNNELFSDVKIVVKGKTIHAHKVVLMSGNEVFAAMFDHDTEESRENVIRIRDIEYNIMLELVRFIYTGQVQNMEKVVRKLLIASDKYGISELKDRCSKYLCRLLSNENVLEFLIFADCYNVQNLKGEAISFFMAHKKDIVKTQGFENTLKNMNANLLAEIITDLSNS